MLYYFIDLCNTFHRAMKMACTVSAIFISMDADFECLLVVTDVNNDYSISYNAIQVFVGRFHGSFIVVIFNFPWERDIINVWGASNWV